MSHSFSFRSVSVPDAILASAEDFLLATKETHGMETKDCLTLARLQVNRFLTDSGDFADSQENKYQFKLPSKSTERADWKRTERSAGGMKLVDTDSAHLLGCYLGWLDNKMEAVEKGIGNVTVTLPGSIEKPLLVVWTAAVKQRAARTAQAAQPVTA